MRPRVDIQIHIAERVTWRPRASPTNWPDATIAAVDFGIALIPWRGVPEIAPDDLKHELADCERLNGSDRSARGQRQEPMLVLADAQTNMPCDETLQCGASFSAFCSS